MEQGKHDEDRYGALAVLVQKTGHKKFVRLLLKRFWGPVELRHRRAVSGASPWFIGCGLPCLRTAGAAKPKACAGPKSELSRYIDGRAWSLEHVMWIEVSSTPQDLTPPFTDSVETLSSLAQTFGASPFDQQLVGHSTATKSTMWIQDSKNWYVRSILKGPGCVKRQ